MTFLNNRDETACFEQPTLVVVSFGRAMVELFCQGIRLVSALLGDSQGSHKVRKFV